MAKESKIQDLEKQILALQEKKRRIEEKRRSKISTIISRCNADKMPDEVLAGAILYASKAFTSHDKVVEEWRLQGKSVLNPGRGKKKFV